MTWIVIFLQVLILGIIPKLRGSEALITILLRLVILLQYVPRFIRIYPLYQEVTKTSGIINETSWAGAAISIFGYILAGHIFGALLYLLRVERIGKCWQPACRGKPSCHSPNLLCGDYSREGGNAFRDKIFSPDGRSPFNHGIYHTSVLLSRDFSERLFYCFWLGLKSLRKKILDPRSSFLQKWNKIIAISCLIAVSIDPLFFYIPIINDNNNCIGLDKKLGFAACILRFPTDIFYIVHILFQFRTGFIGPSSRGFGSGVLVKDPVAIATRYLRSYFLIDILAVLPLPQVIILGIIPKLRGSVPLITIYLRYILLLQYVPRFLRIYPLYKEVARAPGISNETAWAGVVFNVFLYMLAGHIFGALWYLLRIERIDTCWRSVCMLTPGCHTFDLYCGDHSIEGGNTFLGVICSTNKTSMIFNFGIYQSGVVLSRDFPERLFYCFWLGLQSLSSLGQNLKTTTYMWEIAFAASGMALFALVVGNMQAFLRSKKVGLEEIIVKRRDTEDWMSHRVLPEDLKKRIRRYEQYKWLETRGIDEEHLLHNLPKDLRLDIKRHMCLDLMMRVPMFRKMDKNLLDAICDRLQTVLYTEEGYIVREGEPVDEMIFIMRGKLLSVTTNGGRTGFFNSDYLKYGDFCGEELLTWALDPHCSSSNLPKSTRTVQALTEVEGFTLVSDDLKLVASQFRKLHSKQVQHIFRFYSQHWRTWAACFIQAVWRQYSKRKLEQSLSVEERGLQQTLVEGSGTSLGATIHASQFATNAFHYVQRNRGGLLERLLPSMLPQKPAEPDFSTKYH